VIPVLLALLAGARGLCAADVGGGFGESIRILTPARQAGSGGVALEDPWRQGSLVEASSVLLTSGLRWFGFGYQGGLGSALRVGGEGFLFSTPEAARTLENPDGSYGGQNGAAGAAEYGGRILGQLSVLESGGWKAAALCRVSALIQRLPDSNNTGYAVEAGGQAQGPLGGGSALTAWALAGPLGRGAGHGYAGQVNGGIGMISAYSRGLLTGAEGYAIGVEGRWLTEGLMHGGLGGLYWFGRPNAPGMTLYLRAGGWYAAGGAQEIQPRGGLGVLWRTGSGWGVQFDYAVVPAGELGMYHYASLGVRLPPSRPGERKEESPSVEAPKETPASAIAPAVTPPPSAAPPAAQAVSKPVEPGPPPGEDIIYFNPDHGEKARIAVEVRSGSRFAASILDMDGRLVSQLVAPKTVKPGKYVVEWDGKLDISGPAKTNTVYLIRIAANDGTVLKQVVPVGDGGRVAPAVLVLESVKQEEAVYFDPGKGEKAVIPVKVRFKSTLGAFLLDGEGRPIRELQEAREVDPGTYYVEWDGTVGYAMSARREMPYIIRISANEETTYRRVIPKENP